MGRLAAVACGLRALAAAVEHDVDGVVDHRLMRRGSFGVLVGAHADVERGLGLGRDDVVAVAAVKMFGETEVRSIDEWRGSLLAQPVVGGAATASDRRSARRGSAARRPAATISASRLKYAPVVSLSDRSGGCQGATVATAAARCTMALAASGTEPWPAMPCAISSMPRGIFSVVCTAGVAHWPPARASRRRLRRGSTRRRSRRSAGSTMNSMPTRVVPSSPDSARKITSRSSGTLTRFSSSIVISAAVEVVLVVDGAAAVDVAAVARGAERRVLPLRRVDVHDVACAHEQQRPLAAVAFEPRDDVRPMRSAREDLARDALALRAPASGSRPPASRCRAGSLVSMRTSAWKCRSVSASIATAVGHLLRAGADGCSRRKQQCQCLPSSVRHGVFPVNAITASARDGATHTKLAAWLASPLPLYWATSG